MDDVYAVAYIYQFKRYNIEDDDSDIEEDHKAVPKSMRTSASRREHLDRRSRAESYRSARVTLIARFLFMFSTQIGLSGLLFFEQVLDKCNQANFKEKPDEIWITLVRFLCGNVMHFQL